MRGGTYLVFRRIRILVEFWDRTILDEQERTIGRHKGSGAPMGRDRRVRSVAARGEGRRRRADDPHRCPRAPRGARDESRRDHAAARYSFADGLDPVTGEIDAGLLFLAFQQHPETQFVRVQKALAGVDALNEYIKHVGSAIFAVPGGIAPGASVGDALFA